MDRWRDGGVDDGGIDGLIDWGGRDTWREGEIN